MFYDSRWYSYPVYPYPYSPNVIPNYYQGTGYQSVIPPLPFNGSVAGYTSVRFAEAVKDYGPNPYVVNIEKAAEQNNNYRTAIWTGKHLQVTLMSINVGDDIGLEVHPDTDQFIRIEEGQGLVQMGDRKDQLDYETMAYDGYAVMVPAGKWHNITNKGNRPLKVYVIYAPPHHPYGTVHVTKADAMASSK
ncbi:cupin domain-containing protein [Paenibacillus stellifer]|uniref:cupin domain-containing protein n=1 Tax=Paenibacillus stellifer TaxID=169760 RepID=UPI000A0571F7|nr:cupin domain-containing protein [Paenibacillus stellifer]